MVLSVLYVHVYLYNLGFRKYIRISLIIVTYRPMNPSQLGVIGGCMLLLLPLLYSLRMVMGLYFHVPVSFLNGCNAQSITRQ